MHFIHASLSLPLPFWVKGIGAGCILELGLYLYNAAAVTAGGFVHQAVAALADIHPLFIFIFTYGLDVSDLGHFSKQHVYFFLG